MFHYSYIKNLQQTHHATKELLKVANLLLIQCPQIVIMISKSLFVLK